MILFLEHLHRRKDTLLNGVTASVQSAVTCDPYQHVPVESFAEVLLRTGKLAETKTEGEEVFPTTEGMKESSSSLTVCKSYQEIRK